MTIAIVAERGEVRVSGKSEHAVSDNDDEDENTPVRQKQGDKARSTEERDKERWRKRRGPKKYVNLKLCSLPSRSSTLGSGSGASGDALLQLLLFESESFVVGADGKKSYRGGSGGAYERWANLGVGSVVALLNPRVLRPLKVSARCWAVVARWADSRPAQTRPTL